MYKSNRPLICGEKLFRLFLWQIFTECSFYAGLCAECWGYRHELDSLIPQGVVTQGLVRETDILRGELWNNVESTSAVYSCMTVSKVILHEGGGAPSETLRSVLPCGALASQTPPSPPYWLGPLLCANHCVRTGDIEMNENPLLPST